MSTIGIFSSPFSGFANGVTMVAKGIPVFFSTSTLQGIAHIVILINLGEQFPLSTARKIEPDNGGTFRPVQAFVLKVMSF